MADRNSILRKIARRREYEQATIQEIDDLLRERNARQTPGYEQFNAEINAALDTRINRAYERLTGVQQQIADLEAQLNAPPAAARGGSPAAARPTAYRVRSRRPSEETAPTRRVSPVAPRELVLQPVAGEWLTWQTALQGLERDRARMLADRQMLAARVAENRNNAHVQDLVQIDTDAINTIDRNLPLLQERINDVQARYMEAVAQQPIVQHTGQRIAGRIQEAEQALGSIREQLGNPNLDRQYREYLEAQREEQQHNLNVLRAQLALGTAPVVEPFRAQLPRSRSPDRGMMPAVAVARADATTLRAENAALRRRANETDTERQRADTAEALARTLMESLRAQESLNADLREAVRRLQMGAAAPAATPPQPQAPAARMTSGRLTLAGEEVPVLYLLPASRGIQNQVEILRSIQDDGSWWRAFMMLWPQLYAQHATATDVVGALTRDYNAYLQRTNPGALPEDLPFDDETDALDMMNVASIGARGPNPMRNRDTRDANFVTFANEANRELRLRREREEEEMMGGEGEEGEESEPEEDEEGAALQDWLRRGGGGGDGGRGGPGPQPPPMPVG